ncbi:hypothetical protein T492DRAFT_985910 [Pavlovales sp. CCMP2436]|nr:hypothetical protein T492DRAFT_985910 [Pavlovales sp. CCMP2436]
MEPAGEHDEVQLVGPASALGLGLGLPGMADEADASDAGAGGVAAVLFDAAGELFVGVCLLAGGEVVRLTGRVMQSFDCDDDCCKRALIKVRTELKSSTGRMLMQTVLAKSELNLGDFWNWNSVACSFTTEHVVTEAETHADIVQKHFRSLSGCENAIGTAGILCVGPMRVLLELPTRRGQLAEAEGAWPPAGESAVAEVRARATSCSWRDDMAWLKQGRSGSAQLGSSRSELRTASLPSAS